jgi:hypothetical protein
MPDRFDLIAPHPYALYRVVEGDVDDPRPTSGTLSPLSLTHLTVSSRSSFVQHPLGIFSISEAPLVIKPGLLKNPEDQA